MKETVQQAVKKLSIIENRIESLVQLNRLEEAIVKCKKLFHTTTSFAVILFLHESDSLFCEQLVNEVSGERIDFVATDLGTSDEDAPFKHLRLEEQEANHDVPAVGTGLS